MNTDLQVNNDKTMVAIVNKSNENQKVSLKWVV